MSAHEEGHIAAPPSSGALLKIIGVTAATALVALVLFILPAEYGVDPTGLGKATGLAKLHTTAEAAAPAAPAGGARKTALYSTKPYRTNVIEITMKPEDELEYKVALKAGDPIVYSWTSSVKD